MPRTTKQSPESFWAKFRRNAETGCWEWGGYRGERDYGRSSTAGILPGPPVSVGTHRIAWILTNGAIPEGQDVLHTCDNHPCGNPKHLYLGTGVENGKDTARRARMGHTRLTQEQVDEIRRAATAGESQNQIAARLGTTQPTVSKIVSRQRRATDWDPGVVPVVHRPKVTLTPAEVLEIRGRVMAGQTHAKIAKVYGVTRETITGIAKGRSGGHPPVANRRPHQKLSVDQYVEIRARYLAGETQTALGVAFGVTQTSISNIVRGVTKSARGRPIQEVS